jgi:hypothetical protein
MAGRTAPRAPRLRSRAPCNKFNKFNKIADDACTAPGCDRRLYRFTPAGAGVCLWHAVLDAARRRGWPRYLAGAVRAVQGEEGWKAFTMTAPQEALWDALAALA